MSNSPFNAVVVNVSIVLPGLHSWPTAEIVAHVSSATQVGATLVAKEEAQRNRNINRAVGNECGVDYLFTSAVAAETFATQINQLKEYNLLVWRRDVMHEPLPQWAQEYDDAAAAQHIEWLGETADKL